MRSLAPPVAGEHRPTAQSHYRDAETAPPSQRRTLPPLESFQVISQRKQRYVGPTDESNWVLPGRLMVGAFPGVSDDRENDRLLNSILSCGITTFVCLQREYDPDAPESAWRSGAAISPTIRRPSRRPRGYRGRGWRLFILASRTAASWKTTSSLRSQKFAIDCVVPMSHLFAVGRHGRAVITCLLTGCMV